MVGYPVTMLVAIERAVLGSRVATTNPRPWEYDHTFAEPDEATWRKVSLTVERLDGSVVDLELLRPDWWVEANELRVGQLMPLQVEELEVDGHATVTAIEPCPALAAGIGSVVTGRFVTRRVDVLVEATIRSGDGTRETITGTPIHPIWSVTHNEWVPLGELTEGDLLLGETETAVVESVEIHERRAPVYNLEIHGEHVYQIGQLGLLVHNADPCNIASSATTNVGEELTNTRSVRDLLLQVVTPGQRLAGQLLTKIRNAAGFADDGVPLIIDNNCARRGMAEQLRSRGYNVRTVQEIFGTDPGDPAIIQLAEALGGRVLTDNMKDFGRNIGIGIDPRATTVDTWIRLIQEKL